MFQVRYTSPYEGETRYELAGNVFFEFNGFLDTSTVRSSVTVSPALSGPVNFSIDPLLNYFAIWPSWGYRGDRAYSVTIGTGLKASDGTSLSAPFVLRFATPQFKVNHTSPSDGKTAAYRYQIYISTNGQLADTFVSGILVTPPISSGNWQRSVTTCYWNGTLAANTNYTVTLTNALKTMLGGSLGTQYQFSFRTGS